MIDVIFAIARYGLEFVALLLIAQAVLSWLIAFQIANGGPVVQIYNALSRLTDPLLRPIRRMIPPVSGIDLSIMVLLFVIWVLEGPILTRLQIMAHGGSFF